MNDSWSSSPMKVTGISQATMVSAGYNHTCAVTGSGTIRCWGNNEYGQLGNGSSVSGSASPVQVAGVSLATSMSAGGGFTCALLSDGTVRCWGAGMNGEMGNGTTANASTPGTVSGLSKGLKVVAGGSHACGLLEDGSIQCWGFNGYGQLGDGTIDDRNTPISVGGL